jgi:hypothetical protein
MRVNQKLNAPSLSIEAVKNRLQESRCVTRAHDQKGRLGMLSQIAQEVTCLSLHINNAKIVMSFDIHALEGQGDALSQKKN